MNAQWNRLPLAEVVEIASGQVDPTKEPYSQMPHVGGENIESETGLILRISTARELGLTSGKYLFTAGDVLYSKIRPKLNKVTVPSFVGICSADVYPLRPKPGRLSREFLAHLLRSGDFLAYTEKHSSRTNIPKLNRESLLSYEAVFPPLAEQRRIAEMLDRAEALRAKRRAALAQLDTLTQSLFLDLFGDPVRNAKSWPTATLKELGKIKTGGTPASGRLGMFGGSIPFITPRDLESDEPVKRTVTEGGAAEAETVRAGATFVCCIGATIGKMAKATQRSAFNQQINAVEWANEMNDDYGLAALRFFKLRITQSGASTTLPILKKSSFEKIAIPVPPLSLQREFGRRVSAVENVKTAHSASLAELNALFASLQHRAFRGEL